MIPGQQGHNGKTTNTSHSKQLVKCLFEAKQKGGRGETHLGLEKITNVNYSRKYL